ncbi:MAG: hypothetical protein MJ014_04360 [Methanocorpusculum sp.]|nr:hypothetical protein [Methanocorpusculum sp.]
MPGESCHLLSQLPHAGKGLGKQRSTTNSGGGEDKLRAGVVVIADAQQTPQQKRNVRTEVLRYRCVSSMMTKERFAQNSPHCILHARIWCSSYILVRIIRKLLRIFDRASRGVSPS